MAQAIYPVPAKWAGRAKIDEAGYAALYRRSLELHNRIWHITY